MQLAVRMGSPKEPRVPWLIFDLGAGAVLRPATRFDAMAPAPVKPGPQDRVEALRLAEGLRRAEALGRAVAWADLEPRAPIPSPPHPA